jgi:hypothetical protein
MARVRNLDPSLARDKVQRGEALLVCAYEDEAKGRSLLLDGAITLQELRHRPEIDAHKEIIFYCA